MKLIGHTGTHRGKRVLVILNNGVRIIDSFIERNKRHIFLKRAGKIYKGDIRSFSIYKEKHG